MIKHKGMKLLDFTCMWEQDGTKMYKQQHRVVNGYDWILYAVKYPEILVEYERHAALIVKVDVETEVVLMQIPYVWNLNHARTNYTRYLDEWFNDIVDKYGKL